MERISSIPRRDWEKTVEKQGLTFHSRTSLYWTEDAYYSFTPKEIEMFEKAGNEMHQLCLDGAQYIIDNNLFSQLSIHPQAAELIVDSWDRDEFELYGRFDFIYNPDLGFKMIEYNADTPTSLLEAAAIQWFWLQDKFPHKDQFNSIHEKLIARWPLVSKNKKVYFSSVEMEEDIMTVEYLRDTAHQAGFDTEYINTSDIGYNANSKEFRDLMDKNIGSIFKLYPWEVLVDEDFGKHIASSKTQFIEPAWKMLWSNKGFLPILWEIAPADHRHLLPAYFDKSNLREWVKKPLFGREGANVTIQSDDFTCESKGDYGEEGFVYQQYFPQPEYSGYNPLIGLWMIGDECAGMGVRESKSKITDNLSRFIPHIIE